MMEYIKLYWEHNFDDEPIVIFYEVCVEAERLAKRSIDVYANGETKNVDDLYESVIEITPIPTIEEINSGVWGDEFFASLVTQEKFESVWINKS